MPARRVPSHTIGAALGAVGAALLWALWGVPTALSAEEPNQQAYRDLVESSCTGSSAAVRALSGWSHEDIEESVRALRDCEGRQAIETDGSTRVTGGGCAESVPWASAAALHTAYALTGSVGAESLFHLSVAAEQQERVSSTFQQSWSLTAGLGALYLMEIDAARSHLAKGLERFPSDASLLTALGATHEAEARQWEIAARDAPAGRPSRALDRSQEETDRLRSLEEAAALYERALAADSDSTEAHLRLGRVQLLLGRSDAGRENLSWVTENGRDRDLVYLAHLFLGGEQMRSGELDEALGSYRAALKADSRGQAAFVATSNALFVTGDSAAAVDVLNKGLAARRRTRASDPWWRYPEGRRGQLPRLLQQLRQEACR